MENSIMRINFINTDEFCIMHTRSNNAKIIMGTETDDIINELFESFLRRIRNKDGRK